MTSTRTTTRALLTCGVVAGPLWFGVVLIQMLVRPGFDLRRHAISVLSLGDLGWVQVTNFILGGVLMVACAVGMRRALAPEPSRTWGPLLVAAYGAGLIGAGIFHPDPMNGFPPGTPDLPGQISGHGALHLLCAVVSFLSLIGAASVVFARRFAALGQRAWAAYSVAAGVCFLAAWILAGVTGFRVGAINVAFAVGVALAWASITAAAAGLLAAGSQRPR